MDEITLSQNGKFAGRALGVEVDAASKLVRFSEIDNTDDLWLPERFEFQNYILIVRKVAFATRVLREAPQKGRVLKGVVAEIVGYREH